jgi:hypothetical protein
MQKACAQVGGAQLTVALTVSFVCAGKRGVAHDDARTNSEALALSRTSGPRVLPTATRRETAEPARFAGNFFVFFTELGSGSAQQDTAHELWTWTGRRIVA